MDIYAQEIPASVRLMAEQDDATVLMGLCVELGSEAAGKTRNDFRQMTDAPNRKSATEVSLS